MENRKKILIIGNGFGGIYTLKTLHKRMCGTGAAELSLIGGKNYFLFTPLLHEVATGGIYENNVVEPIREVLSCCLQNFHLGKADFVDTKSRTVRVGVVTLPYDYLVLATGAETNFYDIPGAEKHSFPLKGAEDAVRIKNHIIRTIEKASETQDENLRKKLLTFVVVGGGPTGVELTAEIEELIAETFAHYYPKDLIREVSIILVHKGKELVPQFGEKIRKKSLEVLQNKGVRVRLEASVREVGKDFVVLNDDERISTEMVIWVAGIKPKLPGFDEAPAQARDGRLLVNEFFELKNHKDIFAIGDVAGFESNGSVLPALAQVAEKEGKALGNNLARIVSGKAPLPFRYRHSGNLLSLGQWMAAGEIAGYTIYGRFTWWIWRTVYLFKFISRRKKFRVAVDWTMNLFSPRDISEL